MRFWTARKLLGARAVHHHGGREAVTEQYISDLKSQPYRCVILVGDSIGRGGESNPRLSSLGRLRASQFLSLLTDPVDAVSGPEAAARFPRASRLSLSAGSI